MADLELIVSNTGGTGRIHADLSLTAACLPTYRRLHISLVSTGLHSRLPGTRLVFNTEVPTLLANCSACFLPAALSPPRLNTP